MRKVLHVNDYPADQGGGAELMMRRTMELVRAVGWRAEAFTGADLPDARRTLRRYFDNPVARRALVARLDEFRPDVVHLHNYYHLLSPGILRELALRRPALGFKVVMTAHDYHLACPNSGGTWYRRGVPRALEPARSQSLWRLLTRRWDYRGPAYSLLKLLQHFWSYRWRDLARGIDAIICPSRFVQDLLRHKVRHTVLLPHPRPQLSSLHVERPRELRLVYVGRLEPEKGIRHFLESFPATWPGTLTIIGEGSERSRCERLCRKRGWQDRFFFLGRLPHEKTLAQIAAAHVLVLPSRCPESFGLTLLEALSVGTNLLVSHYGAMREMVETAGVGYLFDPESPASLHTQLRRIERDFASGALQGFDVTQYLNERSEAAYVRRLLNIYEGKDQVGASNQAA